MPYPDVGVVQVGAQPVIGEAWARVNSHVTSSDVGKARHVVETQASPSMWQSGRLLPYKTLRFSRAPIFRLRNRGLCPRTGSDVCGVLGNPAASCADTTWGIRCRDHLPFDGRAGKETLTTRHPHQPD